MLGLIFLQMIIWFSQHPKLIEASQKAAHDLALGVKVRVF